ncbi:MAG: Flp pilus assembly complex ATPase component TadA, partial [Candidatus Omnitrophica bacterium]|nr:Flp pilus assembly complex ATPase component TadA [Candidatus Omnitrophota bacterium]
LILWTRQALSLHRPSYSLLYNMDINAQISLIGDILVNSGCLSKEQITDIKDQLQDDPSLIKDNFESFLLEKGLISEDVLLDAYSKHFNIAFLDLKSLSLEPAVVSLIPAKFAKKNKVISVKKQENTLTVAVRNPFDISLADELKMITGLSILTALAKSEDIIKAIDSHYGVGAETVEKLVQAQQAPLELLTESTIGISADIEELVKDTSIINYVNQLFLEAHSKRATDIHIEPFEDTLRIRHRIDGVLYPVKTPKDIKKLQVAIISRLKIMANLNIAEKRRPQDGRCKISLQGEEVDLRFSTFPTLFGEGISIRFLPTKSIFLGLDKLGFSDSDNKRLQNLLSKPNGIILVTGPTGCGKTTTLYACLNHLNDDRLNIVTLEDPVEYQLKGVNQIQINPKVDLTFANGLRSVLRQDPDVIMVGEVRDLDTAQISMRAALTGHLILSTLHTNDAVSSIARLVNIGVEAYLVANTLKGVIAQRLVRRVCEYCRERFEPAKTYLDSFGLKGINSHEHILFKAKGCPECNHTGYRGRIGIFEMLIINEEMSSIIMRGGLKRGVDRDEFIKVASKNQMKSLLEDGIEKSLMGLTTLEEVMRMTEQE